MFRRSTRYLGLSLVLALAGACGSEGTAVDKDPIDKEDDDTSKTDDDDSTEDDDPPPAEDDDDDPPPTPPKDAGKDSGRDAGAIAKDYVDAGGGSDGGKDSSTGSDSGSRSDASTDTPPPVGKGECCSDGNCLCHGPAPTKLTSAKGPYKTQSYTIAGTGCVFYPTDAEPPYAAVAVSDGFLGAGGCNSFQTGQWGPLYASWGIVAMIIDTGSSDQPNVRGQKLTKAIAAFKSENTKSGSPLNGKLAGRYGTSGFSMGGGGTSYSARDDKTLLTDVAIMPWGPVTSGVTVPTLVICGSSDSTAPCSQHGNGLYRGIANTVPKMRVQISSGHAGQPSSGGGKSGEYGLAFQKVFLEGDTRWRPFLVSASSEETNIK